MILKSFSVGVFVDDKQLPEFKPKIIRSTTENRTTCWIPSEAGKKFEVRMDILKRKSSGIASWLTVDGVKSSPYIVPPKWEETVEHSCTTKDGESRDMTFSNIELTDDDEMLADEAANKIGQIILELQTGKYMKAIEVEEDDLTGADDHTLHVRKGKVHERCKKARTHCVAFGEPVPSKDEDSSFKVVHDDSPATVFVFEYTSLGMLQAMRVAPPTPVEEDTTDYDDEIQVINGPSEPLSEDVKELQMEVLHLRARVAQQASSSSSEDRKPSRVKLECGVSRQQHATDEVIDLTMD